jgi:DNA repair protein RadD
MPDDLRPLWAHQQRAIDDLRASLLAGVCRVVLMAPTGSGKTRTAAAIIRLALAKAKKVAFVVPKLSLIDQTVEAFAAEGIHCVGVMQADHPLTDPDQPVQVISAQTLARRGWPQVDLVIIDECHEMHKSILTWIADPEWARVPFIGLSATPWSRGLGRYYGRLIIVISARGGSYAASSPTRQASRTCQASAQPPATSTRAILARRSISRSWSATSSRPGSIAARIGRPFCFCVNRSHARHIAEQFIEAGVPAEYMDGNTPREQRSEIFARFKSGETRIIANVGVLTTGVDLDVRCVIDAKPTKSRILHVQTIGRGLRTAPGKDKLLILDHAGNSLRLGTVDTVSQDYLDDGKERTASAKSKGSREPLPRLCDHCKAIIPHGAKKCPGCGAPIFTKTDVRSADGELVELGAMRSGKIEASIDAKAAFHAELKWIARERGYSPGWVAHKFKTRFNVWPNDWRVKTAEPRPPSLATRNWIKSQNIAWAKGRQAHG